MSEVFTNYRLVDGVSDRASKAPSLIGSLDETLITKFLRIWTSSTEIDEFTHSANEAFVSIRD